MSLRRPRRSPPFLLSVLGPLVACAPLLGACSSGTPAAGPADSGTAPGAEASSPAPDATIDSEPPDAGDASDDASPDAPGADEGAADSAAEADSGADTAPPPTYENPVVSADFPDPFILCQGTTYFAFSTNSGGSNIPCRTSTDLATWTALPDALPALPSWAQKNAGLTWAPSVLQRGPSTFVMYYVAHDTISGFQCISNAVASSPAGPYVDASPSPFVCQVADPDKLCGSIDPSPFIDGDGTAYLVWKSDENNPACAQPPRLWSAPLTGDGLSLAGPATQLLVMDQAWQQPIIEGPSMTSAAGRYFLLYSANAYESAAYAMGYATCLSPSGPCMNVSTAGPFISSAGSALGPGGGEFFDDVLGGRWLVYHAWTAPTTTYGGGGARSMRVDRLSIDGGVFSFAGPTTSPQPL